MKMLAAVMTAWSVLLELYLILHCLGNRLISIAGHGTNAYRDCFVAKQILT